MITLNETKLHLRVDSDGEDTAIQAMIDTATAACADFLNMEVDDLDTAAPAPVKSAALLLVGDLYLNRESQGGQAYHLNPTFERLLNPYRVHS